MPNRNLIYVVDDDTSVLKSLGRVLRSLGYPSVLFPSAEAFTKHVSAPIIYMTGNDSPAVRKAARKSGCLAFLTKPFSAASLADNLRLAAQR